MWKKTFNGAIFSDATNININVKLCLLVVLTHPWVGWAQQPLLAASRGEGQLQIKTHVCQICWTGLTCDQGSGPVLWTYTGRMTLPFLHESPSYG